MNIYKDRLWLALLTGMVSLLMGFCEFYTWRIGWHPGSSPWNRDSLLHVSDAPAVLLLGAATFLVLSLVMKQAGALPAFSLHLELDGRPTDSPLLSSQLFSFWLGCLFFLFFILEQE